MIIHIQYSYITAQQTYLATRCDLSISAGSAKSASGNAVEQLSALQGHIIVDQTKDVWRCIDNDEENKIIDIVMDNAGFELFTDLVLADFLVASKLARKVKK